MTTTMRLNELHPTLQTLVRRANAEDEATQDARAAAARAELARYAPPEALATARAAVARAIVAHEKAALSEQTARRAVADARTAEHMLLQADSAERERLARACHAPYRIQRAIASLMQEIDRPEGDHAHGKAIGRTSARGAALTILRRAVQHIRSADDGAAPPIPDLDGFVANTVTEANEAARDAMRATQAAYDAEQARLLRRRIFGT